MKRSILSIALIFVFTLQTIWAIEPVWIGAITRSDSHLPEGRIYQGNVLREPAVKAAWGAVDTLAKKSIYLRKEFNLNKQIVSATVNISGLGHYKLTLNGKRVGDSEFAPLWSDYDKTVYYNTYDVTALLQNGGNAIGVLLGNGFYNVQGGRYRKLLISFGPPTLYFDLTIRYADGTMEHIVSGREWKYDLSPLTFNCLYGGENYDARLEQSGWDSPNFNDNNWREVVVQEAPKGKLTAQQAPPVKIMERYGIRSVKKLTQSEVDSTTIFTKRTVDPSAFVLDMGQNLAGFPEIVVRGKRGQKVTLLPAESLTKEGAANQLQTGRQHYYEYTLKGGATETWHPSFSYYGFRYIQVEGAVLKGMKNPKKLPVIDVKSCFVYNSAEDISTFECSNDLFNQAHKLIHKAVRSNMQAVFTDCPHREKLGWLEQVHLNGPGLFFNYDLRTYIPKVMQDIADAQSHYANGMIPSTAPQYVIFTGVGMENFAESPEWGSSMIIAPFMYYETYGDNSLITKYYRQMRAYTDYLTSRATNHIVSHGLGDWYDYGDFRAGFSRNTPVPLVATAHYYMDICYMIQAAEIVGNEYDKAYYTRLKTDVRNAFNATFFQTETCQYGTGSQTSNSLPLFLDMVDEQYRSKVLQNLIDDIRAHGNRLTTGDVGNRYLFRVLADNGLNELMYAMHNHYEAPGYGFQLKFGATTLTEQWDPRQGSSWNHFMMGQIDEWFFRSLAGIQQEAGTYGYKKMIIRPELVGNLTFVRASTRIPQGRIAVEWHRTDDEFAITVELPQDCPAQIWLPQCDKPIEVAGGSVKLKSKLNK
ncbi:hydrolase [Bacteroides sp. 214]|uniref:alpha-L-rhamnosidase n=1 Tax=Bacteroides sp. 214 TaxID=2302935 RepID=UPI0013D47A85|nr:alpha-L-rhamnosidase [Bacteroides sp. 214]NDW12212.1 hydrolase [Bacteroides sp. 214]